jgi:hypothetical protein
MEIETRHSGQSEPQGAPNRRLLPRVASRLIARLSFRGMPAELLGQARDIGPGGVCIETASQFASASVQRVSMEFPGYTANLNVAGCWQRNAAGRTGVLTGMRFVGLRSSESEHLWRYVYQRGAELASFLRDRSRPAAIDYDDAIDLAFFTRFVQFPAGDCIHRQGSLGGRGDSAFVVYEGRVMLEARSATAQIVYRDFVESGGAFGGMPILAAAAHPDTATADTDVLLLEIDPYAFHYLEGARPRAVGWLSRALAGRYAGRLQQLIGGPPVRPGASSSRPG